MVVAQDSTLLALRDQLIGTTLVGTSGVPFHLRELLGEGGQGWVYKANYDEPDGMWVVVKMLRPDSVNDETMIRFRREAEVLRMLGAQATPTPNVVRFYDHGSTTVDAGAGREPVEMPFTVLEYVDGVTLASVLDGPPRCSLPAERVRRILRQVVRALETVHAHRVVHRDLKPSNILLTMQGLTELAKVTDFGLVKLVDFKLTQTATVAGASLGYAPPEQYEQGNERVSARTDVFSLATILFEALAARPAFPYADGENPLRVISRQLTGPRPSLARDAVRLSPELLGQPALIQDLDRELERAMQADPERRHPTVREFWNRIEPILKAAVAKAGPAARTPPPTGVGPSGLAPQARTDVNRWSVIGFSTRPPVELSRPVARVLAPPGARAVRGALVGGDGSMMAVGPAGFGRWDGASWSDLPAPPGLEPRAVRGITRTHDGQIVVFGDRGLASILTPQGMPDPLGAPMPDLCFHGALCDPSGVVTLVGERLSREAGVIVQLARGEPPRIRFVEWTPRLRAIAQLASGVLVACGDAGALVRVALPELTPIAWECTGHLHAIAPRPDGGASIVGSGGHALSLSQQLSVQLEAVQTTRDLFAVDLGVDGAMWCAGAAGRVMRRVRGVWERIPVDASVTSRFTEIGPTNDGVLVVGDDGLVLEVRQAG